MPEGGSRLVPCVMPPAPLRTFLALSSLAAMVVVTAPATHARKATSTTSFAYDRGRPLEIQEIGRTQAGGAVVRDITYAAYEPARGRIPAYIVSPPGTGPFAGILFFHWLGKDRSDRTEFLEEATALAGQGVVSVLVQGYFPWKEKPTESAADRQRVIDQVVDTRRAMDLLLSLPGVDPGRVAYVGHDYGAMFGAIIAGLERRASAYVFIAGMGSFADWSLKYWPETAAAGEASYRRAIGDVDPIHYVGVAAPAALLFQFARRDIYITEAAAAEFFDEASPPKEQRWYDDEHDLDIEAAAQDRRVWLTARLALRQP
jgi:dienelactone hydrolase